MRFWWCSATPGSCGCVSRPGRRCRSSSRGSRVPSAGSAACRRSSYSIRWGPWSCRTTAPRAGGWRSMPSSFGSRPIGASCRGRARPYRAQTKGKVERPIRYVRESFFYGRPFTNDADLNEQAQRWLEGTANVRRHGTTGERPVDRFERDERQALRPLASHPYRRLGARQPQAARHRFAAPTVQVQRRPLREYSEAVR
ncbi:MAG: transposase [Gammaproteobacteria bacterium]|nr:transposase [Gammaproteobacteria bacterium]